MRMRRASALVRSHALLLIATTIVAAGVGYKKAPRPSPLYRAEAEVIVGAAGPHTSAQLGVIEESSLTLALLMSSVPTATLAVSLAGVERSPYAVAGSTFAFPVAGTALIDVTVADGDPTVATRLADAMGPALQAELSRVEKGPSAGSLTVSLFQPATATPPSGGRGPELTRAASAALLGFVLAVAAALVLDYLDVGLKSGRTIAALGMPVLGVVSTYSRRAHRPVRAAAELRTSRAQESPSGR